MLPSAGSEARAAHRESPRESPRGGSPERFRRIEALFTAASERPAATRAAWLAGECGADVEMRREVEALLKASDVKRDFLETPADPRIGRLVGRWRLLRRVGAGGMGIVYAAERADGAFEQQVALKVLRASLDASEALERFHRERQVLADLNHPGIARLLDGGTTEDGTPYLVMELVDGKRIDEWCDERRLTIEQRLELFGSVCAAVHYAHQNLVVHRDLKPSNLLVAGDGPPGHVGAIKLLDFGIAKVLTPDTTRTLTIERRLTPEYASPETVRGGAITTATDVYSLGVILYELLTGTRPYTSTTDTPAQIERAICDTIPPVPSRAELSDAAAAARSTTPSELRHALRGDLDAIVATALAKEPARRYASAERLAEDLQRRLSDLPILARPPGLLDTLKLLTRRNQVASLLALVATLVFVAGSITSVLGWITARRNAEAASRQTQVTTKVNELLVELMRSFEPESTVASGPDDMPSRLRALRKRLDGGALADDPLAEATLHEALYSVWSRLEAPHESLVEIRIAAEQFERALGSADARTKRARFLLGRALTVVGELAAGEALIREPMPRPDPRPGEEDMAFAAQLEELTMLLIEDARFEEAEAAIHRCAEIRLRLSPRGTAYLAAMNVLGLCLVEKQDFAAAEPVLRENLASRRKKYKSPERALAISLRNWGCALAGLKRFDEAETAFEQSRAMRDAIYGTEHPFYVNAVENLAEVHRDTGRLESAEAMFREVLRVRSPHFSPKHPDLALAQINLGDVLLRAGKADEARPLLVEGQAMADSIYRDGHPLRERAARLVEEVGAAPR